MDRLKNNLLRKYRYKAYIDQDPIGLERFLNWCELNGIEKELPSKSWTNIIPNQQVKIPKDRFKYEDHPSVFQRMDGSRVFVFQPYVSVKELEEADLEGWCRDRGLRISKISEEESWHYPDKSILIVIELENERVLRHYLKNKHSTF